MSPLELHLNLRLAEANFQKTRQKTLLHRNQAQLLDKKIADAKMACKEARQQQAATRGDPEQYQIASLLIKQTTARLHSLKKERGYEERHFPACIAALKTAKATLIEAKTTPRRTRSAPPNRQQAAPYPVNHDENEPSPFHFRGNAPETSMPLVNGTTYSYVGFLPPAPSLENRHDSAPPTLSTEQVMHALWAPKTSHRRLDVLLEATSTNLPTSPS